MVRGSQKGEGEYRLTFLSMEETVGEYCERTYILSVGEMPSLLGDHQIPEEVLLW